MIGDLIERLTAEGEREDLEQGASDTWRRLDEIVAEDIQGDAEMRD